MDGEEFFDRLYSHYHVHFPCFAVVRDHGQGFATEGAEDGTEALVLLTDEHLLERYLQQPEAGRPFTLSLTGPDLLGKLLDRLPPSITHITFDPHPRFHRRYARGVIRESLRAETARDAKAA